MCEDPTKNLTMEQREVRFAKWKCATIASVVIMSITIIFMIIVLAWQTLMFAETESSFDVPAGPTTNPNGPPPPPSNSPPSNDKDQVQVHRTAVFGYFSGEICVIGHYCVPADLNDLTCGNKAALDASCAFSLIGLFAAAATLGVNIFELCTKREPLPHLTIILLGVVSVSLTISSVSLVVIRQVASYDPNTCPGTIPGLVRYATSDAWRMLSTTVLMVVTMLIAFALRRYANMTCCCPQPTPEEIQRERQRQENGGYGVGPAQGEYLGVGEEEMRDEPPPYDDRAYGQNRQYYGAQPTVAQPVSANSRPASTSGSPVNAASTDSRGRPTSNGHYGHHPQPQQQNSPTVPQQQGHAQQQQQQSHHSLPPESSMHESQDKEVWEAPARASHRI